jgi:hypothetical protein
MSSHEHCGYAVGNRRYSEKKEQRPFFGEEWLPLARVVPILFQLFTFIFFSKERTHATDKGSWVNRAASEYSFQEEAAHSERESDP